MERKSRYNETLFPPENGKNVNSQNPLLGPPTPSPPAGVTALGAGPSSGPPRLAAKLGAPARASADKEQAAATRGRKVEAEAGGGARRGKPSRTLTSPERWPMRNGRGGFPLRLPPRRLFKRYPGEYCLGGVGRIGEMEVKSEKWWSGGETRVLTIRRQDWLRRGSKTRAGRSEAKHRRGQSPPEMEWKLERTARRRVRTEEEMLWVSNVLMFPSHNSLQGLFVEGTVCNTCWGSRGSTNSKPWSFILQCVIYLCSRGVWLLEKLSQCG